MSVTFEPSSSARATLAAATMPRRVRKVLEQLYALITDETAPLLERMLAEFEHLLFRQADQARNPGLQSGYLETLRLVRLKRVDLIPRYLVGLETALTCLHEPVRTPSAVVTGAPSFRELRLVEDTEIDETTALRAIASKHESRSSLPLLLLGQRFGVLAAAPAFDIERLPVGPRRLCGIFAEACQVLQIGLDSRLELYRIYDQQVMASYAHLLESMNALLEREHVLPGLTFVPLRPRPETKAAPPSQAASSDSEAPAPPSPATIVDDGHQPHTAWPGLSNGVHNGNSHATFIMLQQLLGIRREIVEKLRSDPDPKDRPTLSTAEVAATLDSVPPAPPSRGAHPARSIADLRRRLLQQANELRGEATALNAEDNDAFELLDLFYGEIERDLRADPSIQSLLDRLQVPLLQIVLRERDVLVHRQHPALQLLGNVAEAGARWQTKDELDPALNEKLRIAVDQAIEQYRQDPGVFERANLRLSDHQREMARKAEVAERRHVEAARGKEKLELAKQQANGAIDELLREQKLPRFAQTLLTQAWADALTVTLLRHGEASPQWQQQLDITHRIIAAATGERDNAAFEGLDADIEHALSLVGYHDDDAAAISRQLTQGVDVSGADPASRTELAMKVRARGRFGEDSGPVRTERPARSAQEQACWERVRSLPFGTWFEFTEASGDITRRRLSWFSLVTDNALFVNQRGQRVGEQSLDSLARMMALGQARLITADHGRLIDRAWNSTLGLLRGFGSGTPSQERDE